MRHAEAAHLIQSELLVDDVCLVILIPQSDRGPEANLLGFRFSGELIWTLSPPTDAPAVWDGFVNIWIQEDQVWVGSWSGSSLRIDHRTGEVVEQVFTK